MVFVHHVSGIVPGMPFLCTPAKRSFRSAAGQSPFLVLRFWLLPLLFLRQHGRSVPALGVAWRSVPGQLGEAGAPLPSPRCVVPWSLRIVPAARQPFLMGRGQKLHPGGRTRFFGNNQRTTRQILCELYPYRLNTRLIFGVLLAYRYGGKRCFLFCLLSCPFSIAVKCYILLQR